MLAVRNRHNVHHSLRCATIARTVSGLSSFDKIAFKEELFNAIRYKGVNPCNTGNTESFSERVFRSLALHCFLRQRCDTILPRTSSYHRLANAVSEDNKLKSSFSQSINQSKPILFRTLVVSIVNAQIKFAGKVPEVCKGETKMDNSRYHG